MPLTDQLVAFSEIRGLTPLCVTPLCVLCVLTGGLLAFVPIGSVFWRRRPTSNSHGYPRRCSIPSRSDALFLNDPVEG